MRIDEDEWKSQESNKNHTPELTEDERKKKSPLREFLSTVLYIVVVVGIGLLTVKFIGQRTQVSGSSMENTLHDKDNLIVDKVTYRFSDPKRFDIVVFPGPDPNAMNGQKKSNKTIYYIKRIIGLPGEKIQIGTDGTIYINDQVLEESYGREVIENPGIAAEPIQLKEDEYFVLGDNRNRSADSRDPRVGVVKRKELVGRAWVRIWPFNKFGVLKHR